MYYRIFNSFFSFAITGDAILGVTFLGRFIHKVNWIHLLYLLPIAAVSLAMILASKHGRKIFRIRYVRWYQPLMMLVFALAFMTISKWTIPKDNPDLPDEVYQYSDFDLYEDPYSPYLAIKKFGLFTYIRIDLENNLDDSENASPQDEIAEYLSTLPSHELNEYSGLFEGKNLIMIMAESLDTIALDPALMPNLCSMMDESMIFDQYYAPLYYRNTADTEFMIQTSLYPHNGVELSMEAFQDNTFIYTFPRLFEERGYQSLSFHDYDDYFYPRSVFHPQTLGYDQYYDAFALGLMESTEGFVGDHVWPSDAEFVEKMLPLLPQNENFFAYFLSVSGHMPYDSSHEIAVENFDEVVEIFLNQGREMPSENILYYHAAQMEFDKSLGLLLEGLESSGQLADTVIAIFGDHYAYGLDQDEIWAYSEDKEFDDLIGLQRVPFILYQSGMESVHISNVMSSIDMMPTLSNLFSLNLDYQKVFGMDALDLESNHVLFSSGSVLTDDYKYIIEDDEFVFFNEDMTLQEALDETASFINLKFVNNKILESDYFRLMETPVFIVIPDRKELLI